MNSPWYHFQLVLLVGFLLGTHHHRAVASCVGSIWCGASNSDDCFAIAGCEWDRNIDTSCDPVFGCFTSTWWSCDRKSGATCADFSTQSECEDDTNGCTWQVVVEEEEDNNGIGDGEENEGDPDPIDGSLPDPVGGTDFGSDIFRDDYSPPEGLSAGAIVGIVFALLVVHGASLAGFWLYRKKLAGNRQDELTEPDETTGIRGAIVGFVNKYHIIILWVCFGLVILSWIFTVASTGSCQFLTVDRVGFGFFNYEVLDGDGCERIKDKDVLDAGLKAGRTFSVLACLLMSSALVLVILVQLVLSKGRDLFWLALRILLYCSAWCTLLMFLAFGTGHCDSPNVECKVGAVGILNIFNLLLLIGLNAFLFFVDPAPEPALKFLKTSAVGAAADRPASHQGDHTNKVKNTAEGDPEDLPPKDDEERVEIFIVEKEDGTSTRTTTRTSFVDGAKHATRTIEEKENKADRKPIDP